MKEYEEVEKYRENLLQQLAEKLEDLKGKIEDNHHDYVDRVFDNGKKEMLEDLYKEIESGEIP